MTEGQACFSSPGREVRMPWSNQNGGGGPWGGGGDNNNNNNNGPWGQGPKGPRGGG
ncbi:protease modulator HflK, partial [Brucella melitensis]